MRSRSDFSEAVQKIREIRLETGQEVDSAILPSLQRPEQSFQTSETWTVDPRTGWISWSSTESASSSTAWCKPSTWWSSSNRKERRARISEVLLIQGFRLQAIVIPLQATGGCKHNTVPHCTDENIFSRVAQGLSTHRFGVRKNNHRHSHSSCLTRTVHCLTAFLFHFLTAHLPYFFFRTGKTTAIRTLVDSLADLPNKVPSQRRRMILSR